MTKQGDFSKTFDHNTSWKSKAVAENYDDRRFASLGGRIYDRMEKSVIAKCFDAAQRLARVETVLEVACGTGRISEFISRRGYQLTCGDISDDMRAVAAKRLRAASHDQVQLVNLDIYDINQEDEQFDCVCAFRLFQHLTSEQRALALADMARVSKRFVLVNVMFTSAYYDAVRKLRRIAGRYITRYTSSQAEIDRELDYAGLTVVRSILTQPGFNGNRVLLLEKRV
jgi:ubiquinone/menaquinone biosynthesis C-methylase UbiE